MTGKKRVPSKDLTDMGLDEALSRLIQTDRRELDDAYKRVEREGREVEEDVERLFEEGRRGDRRFKRPCRL